MATGGIFGVFVMLVFAALGYLMSSYGYSVVLFIIALFLEPRLEISLSQSLSLLNGDLSKLVNYPVALALFVLAFCTLIWMVQKSRKMHTS